MHDPRLVISLKPQKQPTTPVPPAPAPEDLKPPAKPRFRFSESQMRTARLVGIVGLVLALGTGGGKLAFNWWSSHQTGDSAGKRIVDSGRPATTAGSASDANDVVAKVSRLIELPQGEAPTVAAVTDPTKLNNQAFFSHAKVGDQVLVYTKARKAILYDPQADKIIEVAPIAVDPQQ